MSVRSRKGCPVKQCEETVALEKLMCDRHWNQVPGEVKTALLVHYQKGVLPHRQGANFQLHYSQAKKEAFDREPVDA